MLSKPLAWFSAAFLLKAPSVLLSMLTYEGDADLSPVW
jgi:hypothetical protein